MGDTQKVPCAAGSAPRELLLTVLLFKGLGCVRTRPALLSRSCGQPWLTAPGLPLLTAAQPLSGSALEEEQQGSPHLRLRRQKGAHGEASARSSRGGEGEDLKSASEKTKNKKTSSIPSPRRHVQEATNLWVSLTPMFHSLSLPPFHSF